MRLNKNYDVKEKLFKNIKDLDLTFEDNKKRLRLRSSSTGNQIRLGFLDGKKRDRKSDKGNKLRGFGCIGSLKGNRKIFLADGHATVRSSGRSMRREIRR